MSDLIQALQIFLKYGDPEQPTICVHDELIVPIDPSVVSDVDKAELKVLGFLANAEYFYSYRYGSA